MLTVLSENFLFELSLIHDSHSVPIGIGIFEAFSQSLKILLEDSRLQSKSSHDELPAIRFHLKIISGLKAIILNLLRSDRYETSAFTINHPTCNNYR